VTPERGQMYDIVNRRLPSERQSGLTSGLLTLTHRDRTATDHYCRENGES
jgi:hypothetical protein